MTTLQNVDYGTLDAAKLAFIEASKKTAHFAEKFGFIPELQFGGSANIFSLDLKPFLKLGAERLSITMLPEGLGTADDARPEDLTHDELVRFWRNIAGKTLSCLTNDAASTGMQTILIGLYLPSSTPELVFNPAFMSGFLDGFVEGCKKVGCVYFSGETPQLKDKLVDGKLDIAGALFGVMPPGVAPIDGRRLAPGNKIVFLESTGPHENGFTVLRQLSKILPQGYRTKLPSGLEYWEAINKASHLYTPIIQALFEAGVYPTSIENVTGHGWQKVMRSKAELSYEIDTLLPVPEVFTFIQSATKKSAEEMIRIFNYGVGQAVFVENSADAEKVVEIAAKHGVQGVVAGEVKSAKTRRVIVKPLGVTLEGDEFALGKG